MGTVLTRGMLVELEPALAEQASLRIEEGRIVGRGPTAEPQPGDEIIDLAGKLVLPGFVSGHHHLYSTLLRGAPRVGAGYSGEQATLHRLESSLDLDGVEAAAAAGGLEGLLCGTTTVFDLHASPKVVQGSLQRVARGLADVGLRAVLSYAVSDRLGAEACEAAIDEAGSFLKKARGRIRGGLGARSTDALSPEALSGIKAALGPTQALFQLQIAEDTNGQTSFERLVEAGLLSERTVLAQAIHLSWPELSQVLDSGAWLVHSPRSNMASQSGTAAAGKFGHRALVGTHTQPLDVLHEAQVAWLKAHDAHQPIDILRYLTNGHRLATMAFGEPVGPLRAGAVADLVVFDYRPPTPLDANTLQSHLISGFSARCVESVMVDGIWRLWGRKPLAVNPNDVSTAAREAAVATWSRMAEA